MLKGFKERIVNLGWQWWLVAASGAVILPLLGKYLPFMNKAKLVGWVLFLLNGLVSWWLGWSLGKKMAPGWWIFLMPVMFFIVDFQFLPKYTRYFALFYLGISYLSWSMTKHRLS